MKKFTLLIAILFSIIGFSQNLLTNGDFENGTTAWSFGPQGTVANGEAFYNTTNSAGNLWDTQLVQGGMSFTSGTYYTLTFKARAASNRNITVAIQNVGIWNDQFRQSYALTTSMQTFTATFSAPFTNGNVQIGFLMAGQGSTASVYYDDVVIEIAESGGGDVPPAQPVGFVVNNPTSSSVFMAVGPNNVGGEIEYRLFYSPTATAPANPLTATQYSFGSTPGDGNGFSAFGFTLTGLVSSTNYTFWLYQYNSTTGLYSSPNSVTATTTSSTNVPQPVGFVAINPTSSSMFLAVGPNNTGGNIVYRLFYSPTATAPANPLTATQYTFGSTPGDGNGTTAFGFALSGLNSSTNYTFWLYQFNTSTGIYSLPAVSTNTTSAPLPVLIPPTTNAPIPTRNPANVVSIYSNSYTNIANNYDPNWGQSGHTLVNPNFVAVPGSGNTILHYQNFNYQGTQLNAVNLSDMEFLHVDLWTNAPTSSAIIQVSPINTGSGPSEVLVTINHIQGQWVSVDLPKSLFTGMTWDNVIQMKFAANGPGSTTPIDIYLDNIYFWNNPGVSTDATLSDLQVDFATVDGFSSNQLSYTYSIPFGTTEIPQITSATPNSGAASTVITQATALPGSATVLVTAEDTSVQLTYTVNFAFPPPPAQPVGFVALNPTATSAFLACGPNNVDGTIIYRIFYSPTATAPVDPTTASEYNFGDTAGDGGGTSPFGFNLSGLSSSTNYTFWLYQYNTETNQFSSPATASLTTLCLPLDWYLDNDGDTYGDSNTLITACNAPGANYVTQGGDCNDNDNTINPGATEICYDGIDQNCNGSTTDGCPVILARLRNNNCGATLTSIAQTLRGDFLSSSVPNGVALNGYRFRVTNMTTGAVRVVDRPNYVLQLSTLDIAQYGTVYNVEVAVLLNTEWMPYGDICSVVTPGVPNTVLAPSSCGATLVQMNNIIRAVVVPAAVNYEYEVSLIEGGIPVATTTLIRPGASFNLLQLTNIPIKFGAEYRVRMKVEVPTDLGLQWSSNYGAPCSVFSPAAPEAQIEGCGDEAGIFPASLNTVIYATPVGGATQYRFTLSDGNGYNQVFTTSTRTFRLSNFNALAALTPGGSYSVTVETQVYGFYYTGKDCNITVPGAPPVLTREEENVKAPIENVVIAPFKVVAYPNPFADSFVIDVQTSSVEPISVVVYDMAGRLLETRDIQADDLSSQRIGERYPAGVYNAIVTQGNETRVVRVVKR